jgi:membrane fusion protein (multidrug efflux system)
MKKRMAIMLIICIIIFGGIVGFYFFKQAMIKKFLSKFAPPPATVTTSQVATTTWKPYIEAIGSLKAKESIQIAPELAGKITHIYFKSGQYIEKGAPLVDLNTATQQAQLKADIAQLNLAKINHKRDAAVYKKRAISKSNLDSSFSKLEAQQAAVEGDKAMIAKMHLVAPFSGRLGIREVSLGQYIAPPPATGGNVVQLNSIDPILVQFNMPQQQLAQLHIGQKLRIMVDTYPNTIFTGVITATNGGVTETSRTILVEADVSNPDHKLVPGMFVNVHVLLPPEPNVIIVPQTAVVYSLYGNSVYVVGKDKKVTQTFITIGQTQDINIAVLKGLKPGDVVVTSGQLKLHNGSQIVVNNKLLPN